MSLVVGISFWCLSLFAVGHLVSVFWSFDICVWSFSVCFVLFAVYLIICLALFCGHFMSSTVPCNFQTRSWYRGSGPGAP